jgi:hypothetical protein
VLHLLAKIQQKTIQPIIKATGATGSLIGTDEHDIHAQLEAWGYQHKTLCHERGEHARDEDGDGFGEIHVNTLEMGWTTPGIDVPCPGSCKHRKEPSAMAITMIGLDTAKSAFQVHGVDEGGRAALKRQLRRSELIPFFEQQPRCTVFLEACGDDHPYRPAVAGRFRCADRIVGPANDGRAC